MGERAIIGFFLVGWFIALALAEGLCATREAGPEPNSDSRLVTNFGLGILILLVSAAVPVAKVGTAIWGARIGNWQLEVPWLAMLAILFVADSFATYWAHRLMHAVPVLWRMHRVHHTDTAIDVSTGLRNHPLELLVTIPLSTAVVLALGASVSAILAVQTVGYAASIWQHADVRLPDGFDRALSIVFFTPRLHRLHHSPERKFHDSNYGELLTVWDRLFGTFSDRGERGSVGLHGQIAPPDRLIQQILSPVYAG